MGMGKLINDVNSITAIELKRASETHPAFVDSNHAYGVVAEEVDEACEATMELCEELDGLLKACRKPPEKQYERLLSVRRAAIDLACEAVQTAAMCDKYRAMLEAQNASNH